MTSLFARLNKLTQLVPTQFKKPVYVVPVLLIVLGAYWLAGDTEDTVSGTIFAARRGPLNISVIEGGSIEALEKQEVKSEVMGQTKILNIVEEGYSVTQEDIDSGKVLVELDATELLDKQVTEELGYQNSLAARTEAREQYEIQLNQNRSDITAAELEAKFARMDFEKYLGKQCAAKILAEIPDEKEKEETLVEVLKEAIIEDADAKKVEEVTSEPFPPAEAAPAEPTAQEAKTEATEGAEPAPADEGKAEAAPEPKVEADTPADTMTRAEEVVEYQAGQVRRHIDFSKYIDPELLGSGDAGQKLRKFEDDYVMAKMKLGQASTKFAGTERLAKKEFVTKNELEDERLTVEQAKIALAAAETSKQLFMDYEFPKEAEKLLSTFEEATRKLERAKKLAVSKLAQAEAKLKSSEASYELQTQKRKQIAEQIEKCKIKAQKVGLVVYGGGDQFWRNDSRIEEGATVREQQLIITIPDTNEMAVKIKVHESHINQIEKGQKAKITVDAYPDEEIWGEVTKVAVLPDSTNRWMNPDVKVYETAVRIDGVYPWMKPGMSAQVEVFVKELPDVLYVPIQAVSSFEGQRVCYRKNALGSFERCAVQSGEYNDEFIEISSGLSEGDEVLLRAPVIPEDAHNGERKKKSNGKPDGEKNGGQAAPETVSKGGA